MTAERAHSWTADADLFLPADGLSLIGEYRDSGNARGRFLVGRSDGRVIQLSLLPYLIMAAIAEGGVDGGWSADQVSARVKAASGQGLTADKVRYLIAGTLVPLGLLAAGPAARPDEPPGRAQPRRVSRRPGVQIPGLPRRRQAIGRVPSWPAGGRVPQNRRRLWALAVGALAVLVSATVAAAIMAGPGNREPGAARPASASSSTPASASAASRSQAAAWVAQQVSPAIAVSCDPGMCRQLQLDGFPAVRLKPVPRSARDPLRSGVVVVTTAIRSRLGARLAAVYAPQVIASFGSGAARVDVRMIAPAGAAAFRTQFAAEQATRAWVGRQLLRNRNIQASPTARVAMWAGRVDARLLAILSLLSAQMPVRLLGFTGAPGADPGVPLRGAEIGVISPAARSAMVTLLDDQQSPYRPALVVKVAISGRPAVALRFDAPAALNISQP